MNRTEIRIPGSTSNLGASFDACGLALSLYLRVTVEPRESEVEVVPSGEGAARVPGDESNLIARVARFVAGTRGKAIGGARLLVESEIPLARGLGSSSSAIIAGISVYEALSGEQLATDEILRYSLQFEDHGDNLAPSLLGALVVVCVVEDGQGRSLVALKRRWPEQIKIVLAIPNFEMNTRDMRDALPATVSLPDAVFNVQRASLLQAALTDGRLDLFGEALRDRLHQPHRASLGPGLNEVLKLNHETADYPGLLGVALSGAGSTVVAFATGNFGEIGQAMAGRFEACGVKARVLEVEVDSEGRSVRRLED